LIHNRDKRKNLESFGAIVNRTLMRAVGQFEGAGLATVTATATATAI